MYPCSGWDVVGSESSIVVLLYSGCVRVSVCAPCPTLYDSHESMDVIWYVYGMFAVLLVCIRALVGSESSVGGGRSSVCTYVRLCVFVRFF